MKFRFFYHEIYSQKMIDYLKQENIKYNFIDSTVSIATRKHPGLITFNIWSDDNNAEKHMLALNQMSRFGPTKYAEYSRSDYAKAAYLLMRPKSQSVEIVNPDEAFRYSCQWVNSVGIHLRKHEKQVGPVAIAKEPDNRKSTAFWSEDTGFSVFFTSMRVVNLVEEHNLVGVSFQKVKLRNGNESENIFQMISPNIITQDCIEKKNLKMAETCCICGKEQFFLDHAEQLHVDFSKLPVESDLYLTESIFGEGDPEPLFIISQRFYQLLNENKLTRNVVFTPVVDISGRPESR
jgi:hypothetical protein